MDPRSSKCDVLCLLSGPASSSSGVASSVSLRLSPSVPLTLSLSFTCVCPCSLTCFRVLCLARFAACSFHTHLKQHPSSYRQATDCAFARTHTRTRSLSLTHTLSLSHTHILTHSHSHSLLLSLSQTHADSFMCARWSNRIYIASKEVSEAGGPGSCSSSAAQGEQDVWLVSLSESRRVSLPALP